MLPTVMCQSPKDTLTKLENHCEAREEIQLMNKGEFESEESQRTYQYLKRHQCVKDLQKFKFVPGKSEDSQKEWLQCLLDHCATKNPSWAELWNFTHFLSAQLTKLEGSVFCSDYLQNDLTGFKNFVLKFIVAMSKDFSMRSIKISDESNDSKNADILNEFQLRRQWENEPHPYILFNADNHSMAFLGFYIENLNAVEAQTKNIIMKNVITKQLYNQLKGQGVPFNVQFETLSRQDQLNILGGVLGVSSHNIRDPDETYQLTLDNVLKILAIHLRFQCQIPVIIMGETGCGKTRLVQFLCEMLKSGKQGDNMIVVRVHGGTTSETIYKKVKDAIEKAKENEAQDMDTVLFFDEANTTEAIYAIKEVICDKTVNGEQIGSPRLRVVAACNPYRKHTEEVIEQLERAGLGYRVHCKKTEEKLGQIPMRHLVYRVQPLPPSISPLVWDFGQLNDDTQKLYIIQMVKTFFKKQKFSTEHEETFIKVISASQRHMAQCTDECRMVSLRDIERCMKMVLWFYQQGALLFPLIDEKKQDKKRMTDYVIRSLILAVGVCYHASLKNRDAYRDSIAKELSINATDFSEEINLCQEVFTDQVQCPASTARNDALKENVFMMIVCMNLRVPLFIVGKPGSSKSLSKTIAADSMQGKSSQSALFKRYKQVQLVSFQCSPHSTPEGIISTFRQCAKFQKNQNLEEYVSVVVLDEIGLAEDSPKMPLKTLHPLLEDGCVDDDTPEDFKKVGFVGISNWSLDPAKMNRGILVLRTCPEKDELMRTGKDICSNKEIEGIIPKLIEFYLEILTKQEKHSEFFGLRDYYSLIKVIVSYSKQKSDLSSQDIARAIQRNFGGLDSVNPLELFNQHFSKRETTLNTICLLKENLDTTSSAFTSRFLLLLTTNQVALSILQMLKLIKDDDTEIIFGSGFPHDQEYSQVCRTVSRVKTCMEMGRPVILLNIQSLYESLYDALNQCYVKLGGSYYVDLGLGTHRVKCRVKEQFRLIVIEEKTTVYQQFPAPLLNRLEKHCLDMRTILTDSRHQMHSDLQQWLSLLVIESGNKANLFDIIIGYTDDMCASILLQCSQNIFEDLTKGEVILRKAKEKLICSATPEFVLRLKGKREDIFDLYFREQTHSNLLNVLESLRTENSSGMCLQVINFLYIHRKYIYM